MTRLGERQTMHATNLQLLWINRYSLVFYYSYLSRHCEYYPRNEKREDFQGTLQSHHPCLKFWLDKLSADHYDVYRGVNLKGEAISKFFTYNPTFDLWYFHGFTLVVLNVCLKANWVLYTKTKRDNRCFDQLVKDAYLYYQVSCECRKKWNVFPGW